MKQWSAPLYEPYGSERTFFLLLHISAKKNLNFPKLGYVTCGWSDECHICKLHGCKSVKRSNNLTKAFSLYLHFIVINNFAPEISDVTSS